jgi:hypothetical protein
LGNDGAPDVDDDSIADHDIVYRRVRDDGVNVVLAESVERPSSAAFEPDADGLSVFLHSVLESASAGVSRIVEGMAGEYRIAALAVSDLRAMGLGVVRDPNPDDAQDHPVNPAHALVTFPALSNNELRRLRRKLAQTAKWVELEPPR